jgi:hypothetical protein
MRGLPLAALLLLAGCTCSSATQETLRKAGYTNVTTGGHSFLACSEDDFSATKFTADNPAGERVSGTVCCGVLKHCTIRF